MFKKLLLGLMIVIIFQLSSTSSLQVINPETWSNQTVYKDANLLDVFDTHSRFYDSYFPTKNGIFYAKLDFFAHKIAHITAYSMLSLLFLINIKRRRNAFKKAWSLVLFVAFLDECNQYMIEGRTGLFLDIIVDTTSAFLTLFTVYIAWTISVKNRKLTQEAATSLKNDAYIQG
ncbi:VanZ family protein [Priestia filamentosa]|uniref:VanZ family protein n=1 Tax=Priestia filamentosa TaxID=1402861 RepID=UPI003978C864